MRLKWEPVIWNGWWPNILSPKIKSFEIIEDVGTRLVFDFDVGSAISGELGNVDGDDELATTA